MEPREVQMKLQDALAIQAQYNHGHDFRWSPEQLRLVDRAGEVIRQHVASLVERFDKGELSQVEEA
jgi:hypothetical protein